jgi:hypothetical protein
MLLLILFCLLLTACVPATTPAQLAHTPEPPAVVSGGYVDNGVLRVRYPVGWEVVTGMDGVIAFASSDGSYWALLSAEGFDPQPTPPPGGNFALYSTAIIAPSGDTVSVTMLAYVPDGESRTVSEPLYNAIFESVSVVRLS